MNAEQLLNHYERIADAPDAVKRLRQFVLDLAVRGKLVRQSQNDEPASQLLAEVERRTGESTAIGQLKEPFKLPNGWTWSTVGSLSTKTGSGSTPRGGKAVYKKEGVPFLRSQNVHNDGLRLDDVAYIDLATHQRMNGTAVLAGDLLLNITGGSIGRCCHIARSDIEANISQHVAIIRAAVSEMAPFIHIVVLSPYFQSYVVNEQTGAGRGGLPKNRMDKICIPVPPLAEQGRILARVDELMTLCDQLEAARVEREAARDLLAAASLARLNAPDPEAFAADARFAIDTLPSLTARADQLKQFRQLVLNLAVSGSLVPQESCDEPAHLSIARADEVRSLTAKSDRRASPLRQAMLGFDRAWKIPESWEWRGLSDLALFIDYRGKTPVKTKSGVPLVTAKNVKQGFIDHEPREFIASSAYKGWMTRGLPKRGDVLFTTEAPMGNAAVVNVDDEFALAQRVINFRLYGALLPEFLITQLLSQKFRTVLDSQATGLTAKGIKAAKLKRLPIAVPPLAEQRRIVAKVDELMALCDQLEASLTGADDTRRRLLDALLAEALQPALQAAA